MTPEAKRQAWREFYRAKQTLRDAKASAIAKSDARLLLMRKHGWSKNQVAIFEKRGTL